jgi:hypothetical protein
MFIVGPQAVRIAKIPRLLFQHFEKGFALLRRRLSELRQCGRNDQKQEQFHAAIMGVRADVTGGLHNAGRRLLFICRISEDHGDKMPFQACETK